MFPCKEDRVKWDEYGEIIKPEDYLIPEANAPEEETKIKTVSLYQPRTQAIATAIWVTRMSLHSRRFPHVVPSS
jgi:hypothetical protein